MCGRFTLLAVAGLWDTWKDPTGQAIHTCTILTSTPNELMTNIHDRMPVILSKEERQLWLNPSIQDRAQLKSLLVPYAADQMTAYEVSTKVNSPMNNSVELIEK